MEDSEKCPFLHIPTELRLFICEYALLDSPAITIGTAELVGKHADVVHRLYANNHTPFPGIPINHEPLIEHQYNPSLLSVIDPAVIPLTPLTSVPPEDAYNTRHSTRRSLLLTNKQVKEELTSHLNISKNSRTTSLFVSYPDGLHILKTLTPHLIQQAQSLHLAGTYISSSFDPLRAACLATARQPTHPALVQRYNGSIIPDTASTLGNLIASAFGPEPTTSLRKLELRIYYPGAESYSTVWGDDNSPTCVALRSVCYGELGIECWRGRNGTGVFISVRPCKEEEKKRVVSTVWRRLEEGGRGEAQCGTWVVDAKWPDWQEDGEEVVGEGCLVESVPRVEA